MNSSDLELKKIAELKDLNFLIPSYQRGYRWNKRNVEQLFEDISSSKNEYRLQPLIINDSEEKIRIVDGQQRLTTIFIMLAAINAISPREDLIKFQIEFETREKSKEFLNGLEKIDIKEIENEEKLLKKQEIRNIDFEYMAMAFYTIVEKVEKLEAKEIDDFLKKLYNSQFIWYPLEIDEKLSKEEQVSIEIEQFARINRGKIPLTNAELIKVEFLKLDGITYQMILYLTKS